MSLFTHDIRLETRMLQDLEAIKNADVGMQAKPLEEAASNAFNFEVNETPYEVT